MAIEQFEGEIDQLVSLGVPMDVATQLAALPEQGLAARAAGATDTNRTMTIGGLSSLMRIGSKPNTLGDQATVLATIGRIAHLYGVSLQPPERQEV